MKTPRTDKEIEEVDFSEYHAKNGTEDYTREMVDVDFAKQLETELAEARAEITRLKGGLISQAYQDLGVVEYGIGVTSQPEPDKKDQLIEKLAGAINDAVSNGGMCDYNDEILREALQAYKEEVKKQ